MGNLYWNINKTGEFMNYSSFTDWAHATGHEMKEGTLVGMFEDPLIYNLNAPLPNDPKNIDREHLFAFYPSKGSPAIDNSYAVNEILKQKPGGHDLVGYQIPVGRGYDFGALEFFD